MTAEKLIDLLKTFPADTPVVIEDLNGLIWFLEPDQIRENDGEIVIGSKDLNAV